MKTRVKVMLYAEQEVEIEVEHAEGDDPTDLTEDDAKRVISAAEPSASWEVDWFNVRKV